jgi:DNA end-binding protein Ku
MVNDPVQERLLDIIAAKKKGKKREAKAKPVAEEGHSNVINIMEALRKSIGEDAKTKRK